MPQLSPLNWIFLFFLLWFAVFLMISMIWWEYKSSFSGFSKGVGKGGEKSLKSLGSGCFRWSWK